MKLKPYFRITTLSGVALTNVTKFSYKFSEEEDEKCTFTIQSDNPFICDDPNLQEGKRLEVEWGFIDGQVSKRRVVFIFDTSPEYNNEGITLEITCHEKFVLAKMDAATNKNSKQLKDVPVLFSTQVISNIRLEIEKGNDELLRLIETDKLNLDINSAYSQNNNGDILVSYYNGNHSTFKTIRTFLDKLPGGPYVIDSRDEGVIIRTRDFKQDSLLTFSYNKAQGSPILSFKPETKNRTNKSGSEEIKVTSWDPAKKTAVTQVSSANDKGKVKLANGKSLDFSKVNNPSNKNIPDVIKKANDYYNKTSKTVQEMGGIPVNKEKKEPSKLQGIVKGNQQATNAGKDLQKYKDKLIIGEGKLKDQTIYKLYLGKDYGSNPAIRGVTVARDNTAVAKTVTDIVLEDSKPGKNVISPESAARAKALADNERSENELNNNPATATMEGEPSIETGKIITILGVANRHAGNYYIMDCEHTIDDNGYITNITKMTRQGINKNDYNATTAGNTLPQNKYFYDLNKPENFKWKDGDVINVSKGEINPEGPVKKSTIKSKPASKS